jgi:RES domain-containing protein
MSRAEPVLARSSESASGASREAGRWMQKAHEPLHCERKTNQATEPYRIVVLRKRGFSTR